MNTVFNILDYGAVGDGLNDCTSAIQAAMDAASTKMYPVKWTHELATNPNCVHLKR